MEGLILVLLLSSALAATEVLRNHDMERVHMDDNWKCASECMLNTSSDSYHGNHSVMVSHRHHNYDGLTQDITVVAGARYNFSMYIKLLNVRGSDMFESADLRIVCMNAQGHSTPLIFAREPYARVNVWTELIGIMSIPQGYHSCHVLVMVGPAEVNYLADHASLMQVPDNTNWRTEADARIDKLRKANITVHLAGPNYNIYEVEIEQKHHEFAFGSAVSAQRIVDPASTKYQDAFYENFEWAVLENALKWGRTERIQGHANYTTALTAIHALRNHGVKVRGHNIFWEIQPLAPPWVTVMNRSALLAEIQNRINSVVGATKGLLEHWDVNNEALHGYWLEQVTGNPNITAQMFKDVHRVDSQTKLFLNDYAILRSPNYATAYKNQALLMRDAGAPMYGVGIQSHIKTTILDIVTMKEQLDTVARAGYPIWITELSLKKDSNHIANISQRAAALTDLLTLYFSHPAIEGILFWGFWDGQMFDPAGALFEGSNVTPNEVGLAYQKLYKTTWRTHQKHSLKGGERMSTRAFKGTYSITVKQGDNVLKMETFTLDTGGKDIEIHLHGTPQIIIG